MFDSLVRNIEFVSRVAKGVACWVLAAAVVWRGYAGITGVGCMYSMVLCVLFAFSMVGLGLSSMVNERQEG